MNPTEWIQDIKNRKLFSPYNARPNSVQVQEVFQLANRVDPTGNHKPSSCGRCYSRALKALQAYFNNFE